MSDPTRILVTGANRGIGLGYVREWLARGARVFATARRPDEADELNALADERPDRLTVLQCDVTDPETILAARDAVAGAADGLEVVVNNAGVMGQRGEFEEVEPAEIRRVFEVNTLGPIRVAQAFLPLLRGGREPRRLVHMTSLMGSIDDNSSGDAYPYRISKCGLNMANRSMAVDLAGEGIVSVVLHPGWVKTGMGGSGARVSVQEAVEALVDVIERLDAERSGGFYDRDGEPLPW
ncbi:MAG: SDR family oxidoreductase [Gemmatimonadetes bacterium]|nr:SDR family oxidoreductase [Gemmatimonadota bacterium]